jgi:hypothetical protein
MLLCKAYKLTGKAFVTACFEYANLHFGDAVIEWHGAFTIGELHTISWSVVK